MPTKIKPDFKPSQRVYELLKAYGIPNPEEFVGHELGEFFLYWEETGKAKSNWNTTCLNWMKRKYEDKKAQMARHRPLNNVPGDPFEKALQMIEGGTLNSRPTLKKTDNFKPAKPEPLKPTLSKAERIRLADQYLAGLKI